jgi:hypothetical protein
VLQGDVVVLALLGPHWASSLDAQGRRRVEDPPDSNRVELETALANSLRALKAFPRASRTRFAALSTSRNAAGSMYRQSR